MELHTVKNILEAILLSVDKPMDVRQLDNLFEADEDNRPSKDQILEALQALQEDYQSRGMELTEVSSGYRIQVREDYTGWISRLWEEKAPRYSRALLETLVLIAYRQPITRGEIEEIRGVSVSSHIMKTLLEREWVRVLGHKDVPGKPSMYGTSREFLDYFNLKTLDELPPLSDIKDLDRLHPSLELDDEPDSNKAETAESAAGAEVTVETESETDNADGQANAPDDSYEAGAEEADEDVDEKLEHEKQVVSHERSESEDLDEPLEESAEDIQSVDEGVVDVTELETRAVETTETESEMDDTNELVDAAEGSSEVDIEEADEVETLAAQQPAISHESAEAADMDEEVAEELLEQDAQPASEEAEITEPDAVVEAIDEEEPEVDDTPEPLDALEDSSKDEVESDDESTDDDGEQEKQEQQTYEPSAVAGMKEPEPAQELPEQEVESKPERSGWTMLAHLLWERLKRLVQKPRKRLEHAGDSIWIVEFLTSVCYRYKHV
ncbi:MAG: SMC-Scp complex subunit ScpB [Gammaproteobacteria bacterium]|nr:SMC-Scp complex subunit ScpB [Gammaproteobacteria bacterium]